MFAYFARHPTAANLLMVVMLLSGLAAATQIRSQFFPDVVVNSVEVTVLWEGAGAEDIDEGVVALLEPALMAVEGVEGSEARATDGRANIDLEFEPGWDMTRAMADVETAVAGVTNLPEGADDPEIERGGWGDRVTDVVIWGPVGVEQLGRYADEFVAALYRAGITRTTIQGIADPLIRIEVPEAALIRHGIGLREVADVVAAGTVGAPAGEVTGDSTRLRAGSERREAEAIGALPVRTDADGGQLLVRDVALVTAEGADSGRAYFRDGHPAVSIRVDRSDQGDAIAMQRDVRTVAATLAETLPEGVEIELVRTRAEAITDRLDLLLTNGLMGLALVVGLLFLFLNARTAFWVAAGIPVAMTAAIGLMYLSGLTLNMISLFGLILCLGLVVDDAIVVAEHADWRFRRLGEAPAVAAESAARVMALPVFSAMVTTVLAFFGLTLIGGRFGSMIADIPFTVIVVLIASLVECFLILPHHMAGALAAQARQKTASWTRWLDLPSRVVNRALDGFRARAFMPLMGWVIRLRYPAIAAAVLLVASASAMFVRGDVTWRFFASPERGSITANIAMLPSAERADTLAMIAELDRAARAVDARLAEEHGEAPVTLLLAQVGGTSGRGISGSDAKDPDQLGALDIELIDPDRRPYSSDEFLRLLQEEVVRAPLMETLSFRSWGSGPGGEALEVSFYGDDVRRLKAAAEDLKAELAPRAIVTGAEDSLAYDKTELVLELTPLGARLGFTIDAVGAELRARLTGIEAADFAAGTRSATVRVGLPEEEMTADFLDRTRLSEPWGRAGAADGDRHGRESVRLFEPAPGERAEGGDGDRRRVGGRSGRRRRADGGAGEHHPAADRRAPRGHGGLGRAGAAGARFPVGCADRLRAVPCGHLSGAGLGVRELGAANGGDGDHPAGVDRYDLGPCAMGPAAQHVHGGRADRHDRDHHQQCHRADRDHRRAWRAAGGGALGDRSGRGPAPADPAHLADDGAGACAAGVRTQPASAVPEAHRDHAGLRAGDRFGADPAARTGAGGRSARHRRAVPCLAAGAVAARPSARAGDLDPPRECRGLRLACGGDGALALRGCRRRTGRLARGDAAGARRRRGSFAGAGAGSGSADGGDPGDGRARAGG